MVSCPECGAEFDLPEGTVLNEIIVCPECGIELEVISLDPARGGRSSHGRRRLGRIIAFREKRTV